MLNFKKFLLVKEAYGGYGDKNFACFYLSEELINLLSNIKNNKLSELYLSLSKYQDKSILQNDLPNYLSFDSEGNLTFLKNRYSSELDKWNTNRRTKMKMSRAIKLFYKEDYLEKNLKHADIDIFNKLWNDFFNDENIEIVELRGDDVLRAYNYTRELDQAKFGFTCANFGQNEPGGSRYQEPKKSWFDIYTKNPNNIGVVVAIKDGKIVGRRNFQEGEQVVDYGKNKAGTRQTVYGYYYGELGRGSIYDMKITDYLKSKGGKQIEDNPHFIIQLDETKFPDYCPFDSMYVNFENNWLSTNCSYGNLNWYSTYKAHYNNGNVRDFDDDGDYGDDDDGDYGDDGDDNM